MEGGRKEAHADTSSGENAGIKELLREKCRITVGPLRVGKSNKGGGGVSSWVRDLGGFWGVCGPRAVGRDYGRSYIAKGRDTNWF